MTLTEYSTLICSTVNQSDATSVAKCKQFLQMGYRMIYDYRNWKDILKNTTASLTDTVTGLLPTPVALDRILAIRLGGDHILMPVDSPEIMQIDPTSFERTGTPIAYEEFRDDAGVQQLRFIPLPQQTFPLLITGRRAFVQLTDDAQPIIRNIDNSLIAYAHAKMLERQRQYGKAQAKIEEYNAYLQLMVRSDTELTGNMPRIIPVTEPGNGPFETCMSGWF